MDNQAVDAHRRPAEYLRDLGQDLSKDLAPRAVRRSRASVRTRARRLRSRIVFILQCSLGAGAAWWLARTILDHQQPYLAPVSAIICLGLTFGQRFRRIVEVTVGVAVGVLIGSVFAHLFGAGEWQIFVVAAVSMCSAALLGGGVLISTQAAVQSIIVMTLVTHDDGGIERWFDAVIGSAVALVIAAVAPVSPIERPRDAAARVATTVAGILRDAVAAYRASDLEAAGEVLRRARLTEDDLDDFSEATREGLAVVRSSPLFYKRATQVREVASLAGPLDRAVRNLRVLVRRVGTAIWRSDTIDDDLLDGLMELARIIDEMSNASTSGTRLRESRDRIVALGNETSTYRIHSLSSAVLTGQVRSLIVDLLEITGLSYEEARRRLPAFQDEDWAE